MSNNNKNHKRTRAQESSNAIERMYITMRHLFNRGFYKPMGVSGETLREALLLLRPEIYGSIADEKAEIEGLLYVIDRLPQGIEECSFINLTSDEGYANSHFKPIIPKKRRRNCYRIDSEQMNIEITRGRSEIYDILTHLTFLFVESHKISKRVMINEKGDTIRDWDKLEKAVKSNKKLSQKEREIAITHTANILGRTFNELTLAYPKFAIDGQPDRFLHIIYWLGKLAIKEKINNNKRTITFSPVLRERLGHHIHGEIWADEIKRTLSKNNLLERPIHIISANMHSVMNTLFTSATLKGAESKKDIYDVYKSLSDSKNQVARNKVERMALDNGMIYIKDSSGTNIDVQIFDTDKIDFSKINFSYLEKEKRNKAVIFVMDYAFGEQAYETLDEFLKPIKIDGKKIHLNVQSISIMGKAGILDGGKGDVMIPSAHIFEGTADNYPFKNQLTKTDLVDCGVDVYEGTMITVLGTSLQNKEILKFFKNSTWNVIGLEMEGAHYQKAVQAASKVRGNINEDVKVRYAYYASDNPLETGSTLASGGLGTSGVKPTYVITNKILEQIFNSYNMSDKLPNSRNNDEIDLIQLFKLIGRAFEKLYNFLRNTFKGIFSILIYTLKPVVSNFKIITIILFSAVILGFITERFSKPVYVSDMLVRPYFDSKYQLSNNVDYFNALIDGENYQELSKIFEIDSLGATHLLGFEMKIGPETENELLQQYDNYIKTIDSTLAEDVSYEDYIGNRDILSASVFSIKARSSTHDIFSKLERGFAKTFENEYSKKLKRIRDSTFLIKRSYHLVELRRVDSLQKVYLNILVKESDKDQLSLGEGGLFPITQERSVTREYDLFQEELKARNSVSELDQKLIEESEFYDILSGFEDVGTIETDIYRKYTIIFPIVILAFMILMFTLLKLFKYIKEYE